MGGSGNNFRFRETRRAANKLLFTYPTYLPTSKPHSSAPLAVSCLLSLNSKRETLSLSESAIPHHAKSPNPGALRC